MRLIPEHIRALRVIAKRAAHDTEDRPIETLDELIQRGLARVTDRYTGTWGGKRHQCRMVGITEEGRKALNEAEGD